jgi:hypothetical protein
VAKSKVIFSALAASAGVAALAYAVTRRSRRLRHAQAFHQTAAPEPARELAQPSALPRSIASVGTEDEPPEPTAQLSARPPAPLGADDVEALDPEEIGADWLARATQSERSASESDLELELENLAAPLDDSADEEGADSELPPQSLRDERIAEVDIWAARDET